MTSSPPMRASSKARREIRLPSSRNHHDRPALKSNSTSRKIKQQNIVKMGSITPQPVGRKLQKTFIGKGKAAAQRKNDINSLLVTSKSQFQYEILLKVNVAHSDFSYLIVLLLIFVTGSFNANFYIIFWTIKSCMSEQKAFDFMFKVILIGPPSVGKSKILNRYLKGEFFDESTSTVGVEFATNTVTTAKGTRVRLQIWDTAGQQTYKSLMKIYYKGASAALFVYDITKQKTFFNLGHQIKMLKDIIKGDIVTMIVGNKADLQQERTVSKKSGLQFAQNNKYAFYETSAKNGTNIDIIFTKIAQELQKIVDLSQKKQAQKNHEGKTKILQSVREEVIVLNKSHTQQSKISSKERKQCCK